MRSAVIRVRLDTDGVLSDDEFLAGLRRLRSRGLQILDETPHRLPGGAREVKLIVESDDLDGKVATCVQLCSEVFETDAMPGVTTFVSRGTDDDAQGVLDRFGVCGQVSRSAADKDLVTVVVSPAELARVPESRLQTALEAALNCDVEITTQP